MMRYLLLNQTKSDKDSYRSCVASSMMAKDTEDVIVKSKYFYKSETKKSKRFRIAFTTEQINYLENEFRKYPYIGSSNRKEVANKLKIPERAVKIWFQNRRMKEKKENSSINKDFEIIVQSKYFTNATNEPLNNRKLNNDIHYNSYEQGKGGLINNSVQQFPVKKTNKEKVASPNIPTSIANLGMGANVNNFCNQSIAVPKTSVKKDTVPVIYKKVKVKSNAASVAPSKPKSVNSTHSKIQNKTPNKVFSNNCSSGSNSNIDQDMPQDLSSRRALNKLHSQPYMNTVPVQQALSGPRLVPLPMQSCYPSPVLPPGNVIWRPVNMLSAIPIPQTSAIPLGVPQNSQGLPLANNHGKKSCSCNCHGPLVQCFNQVNPRAHPQYILAIPFGNPPK